MKKFYHLILAVLVAMSTSCNEDDDQVMMDLDVPDGTTTTFQLPSSSELGISGSVVLKKLESGFTEVQVILDSPTDESYSANVRFNSIAEGGDIAISLNPIDQISGTRLFGVTRVTALEDGTSITYDQLVDFDGYLNVLSNDSNSNMIVAQGDLGVNVLTGESKTYTLFERDVEGISGEAIFEQRVSGKTLVTLDLSGTPDGGMHPAHIHMNSAAEGGDIAVSFEPVDGDTGMSMTTIRTTDDGTEVSYEDLLTYDGYINVHLGAGEDLSTIVAQGDIGTNELTDVETVYQLGTKDVEGISGTATFTERVNGTALITLDIEGTPDGGMHPAHIHRNTALEGGDIALSLATVDGDTGISYTSAEAFDDGTPVTYAELIDYDGYINVHLGAGADLSTIVAQGDIGSNALTGNSKTYELMTKDVDGIMGEAIFEERNDGTTLVTLDIEGISASGMHPAHIHWNSALESGAIALTLTTVDGDTGMSMTDAVALNDGTPITYDELLGYDGYINVHLGPGSDLATIVAQGDIGSNELTGMEMVYDLMTKDVDGIMGTATFMERKGGAAIVELMLENTPDGGMHPAHIHENSAIEGGDIIVTFNPVNGTTGYSATHVEALNDGTEITYSEMLDVDGYINVHLSADELGTIVAQGDIGANELTGESITYDLDEKDVPGISGTATLEQRKDNTTLLTLDIMNTPAGGMHPAHIHMNSAEEGGDIAITLATVVGDTGMSMTQIEMFDGDDETPVTYDELLEYDGYINVHLSADELGTIVAQGDIGSNVEED
ncbi:MAG: CHRD domain-containing protein [Leeuwenhoekiella sp.]